MIMIQKIRNLLQRYRGWKCSWLGHSLDDCCLEQQSDYAVQVNLTGDIRKMANEISLQF